MLFNIILLVLTFGSAIQLSTPNVSCSLRINGVLKLSHSTHSVPRKRKECPNRARGSRSGDGIGIIWVREAHLVLTGQRLGEVVLHWKLL
jgi:hypothetical protein